MIRACLCAFGAAALGLCLLGNSETGLADRPAERRPTPVPDRSCKPHGPVEVELLQAITSAGVRVDLELSIRPRHELQTLEWSLLLPLDAQPLQGELQGEAARVAGEATRRTVSVVIPEDGRFRRASLVVRGSFVGHDVTGVPFDEPFEVVKHLSWGELPDPGVRLISRDAESGELVNVAALPTAHRKGR